MKIKKVSGTAVLKGNVVDNLTDNSTENAPSINAIKNQFMFKNVISDADDINETGMFWTYSQTANLPMTGSAGFLVSFARPVTDSDKIQYWFRYRDKQVYCREYNKVNSNSDGTNKAWSDWEKSVLDKYSTDEQIIGTWFGKPLYRKYFTFNLSTSSIYNSIAHGINNIDYIFKVEGSVYDGQNFYIIPSSFPSDNVSKYGVTLQSITKTNIIFYTGTENKNSNMNAKVFIYYTKTTD